MLIDKGEIERVKQANELVHLIRSRGVTLTQRGKQLVGLCPFHDDHEPSLVVDARKQRWNCLGACHEGGDVYRFVMKADGVEFREAHRRLGGHEIETKSVAVEDQQWLERAVDHYHARLLETPAAQDYLRSRGIMASEFVTSFRVGYADGTLAAKLPAEGRRALRRVGVLTGSGRELMCGCVLFPLVAAGGANSGHVVELYGRSIEGRKHLYLPGERRTARGLFAHEAGQVRLFVSSRSGGPLDDDDIVRIVAKAANRPGLSKHVTPHTLRHTCATHLLKGRADIRQIQKLLGHRRLSSTEVYTRVELTDLHEVIARCHPREKRSEKQK